MKKIKHLLTEEILAEVVDLHNHFLEERVSERPRNRGIISRNLTSGSKSGWIGRTRRSLARLATLYAVLFIVLFFLNFFIVGLLSRQPSDPLRTDFSFAHLHPAAPGTLPAALNEVLPW